MRRHVSISTRAVRPRRRGATNVARIPRCGRTRAGQRSREYAEEWPRTRLYCAGVLLQPRYTSADRSLPFPPHAFARSIGARATVNGTSTISYHFHGGTGMLRPHFDSIVSLSRDGTSDCRQSRWGSNHGSRNQRTAAATTPVLTGCSPRGNLAVTSAPYHQSGWIYPTGDGLRAHRSAQS